MKPAIRWTLIVGLTTLLTLAAVAEYEYFEMAIKPYTLWDNYLYNHMQNHIPW